MIKKKTKILFFNIKNTLLRFTSKNPAILYSFYILCAITAVDGFFILSLLLMVSFSLILVFKKDDIKKISKFHIFSSIAFAIVFFSFLTLFKEKTENLSEVLEGYAYIDIKDINLVNRNNSKFWLYRGKIHKFSTIINNEEKVVIKNIPYIKK